MLGGIKMDQYIRSLENEHLRDNLPKMGPGDTVRVSVRIKEGNKERIQAFEGIVMGIRGSGTGSYIKLLSQPVSSAQGTPITLRSFQIFQLFLL